MEKDEAFQRFLDRIRAGRKFEEWEKSHWNSEFNAGRKFEVTTEWNGKKGRMDIILKIEDDGSIVLIEMKATNWDKLKEDRISITANRHAKQIWRYICAIIPPICEDNTKEEKEEEEENDSSNKEDFLSVIPAIVYPSPPITPGRKEQIEDILNDQGLQVVWREEYQL